jgi:hypothetical protein
MIRYFFVVRDLHPLLLAGLPAHPTNPQGGSLLRLNSAVDGFNRRLIGNTRAAGLSRSQRLALQRQAMTAREQPVEDRVGDRRITDPRMPMLDGQLECGANSYAAVMEREQQSLLFLLGMWSPSRRLRSA